MAQDARSAGVDDIQFFSDADMKWDKGSATLKSTYPSWYFEAQLDDKKEELRQRTRKPAPDEVTGDIDPEYIQKTQHLADTIKTVESAKPKLNGAQKTFLSKSVRGLEDNIAQSMFSYDDMHTGEASAHEELKRQINPCIPIDKRLADLCNLKSFKKGMVSRDDATIAMQIINKALGEPTNSEGLRRRNMTCRTQRVEPFTGNEFPTFGEMMELPNGRESASPATE